MAEGVDVLRKAAAKNSARAIGQRPEQPNQTVAQQKTTGRQADVLGQPHQLGVFQPLQDLDPASSTFGGFYFLPGYSVPGGPDIIP